MLTNYGIPQHFRELYETGPNKYSLQVGTTYHMKSRDVCIFQGAKQLVFTQFVHYKAVRLHDILGLKTGSNKEDRSLTKKTRLRWAINGC